MAYKKFRKKNFLSKFAVKIFSLGKKFFVKSTATPETVVANQTSKISGDTLENEPFESVSGSSADKSVKLKEAIVLQDDDDDDVDFFGYQKRTESCIITVDDISGVSDKSFEIYIEEFNGTYKFKLSEDVILLDVNEPGEYECIYEYEKNPHTKRVKGKIVCIADIEMYKNFSKIEDLRKRVSIISGFVSCLPKQQEYMLKNMLKPEPDAEDKKEIDATEPVTDVRSLETMYTLCKDSIPSELQLRCKELEREMHRGSRQGAEAARILSDILHTTLPNRYEHKELPSYEECVKILKKHHYGDDALIRGIALRIRLLSRMKDRNIGTVFALLGSAGVGKTSLAKGIAECFGLPYAEVSCRDKNPVDLAGISRMYEGSRHGEIIDKIIRYKGYLLLLLDEFDKMSIDPKEGKTDNLFDTVFDARRTFCDRFSNFPCPVDNVVFVITCNDIEKVSDPIRNRFQGNIFTVPDFDFEKKAKIGEKFFVPKFIEKYNFTEDDVVFTQEGLLAIAKTTTDAGARLTEQQIENILGVVNNKIEYGETTPIVVDKAFVDENATEVYSDEKDFETKPVKGFCA